MPESDVKNKEIKIFNYRTVRTGSADLIFFVHGVVDLKTLKYELELLTFIFNGRQKLGQLVFEISQYNIPEVHTQSTIYFG